VAHDHWRAVTAAIDPDLLGRLLLRYGAGALGVLQILHQEPALTKPLCPHHEVIEAEVVHAVQGELACTVTDVLARRTRIAWSPCHGLDALPTVASLIERAAGLSPAQRDRQVEAYRHFLASTVALRHVPAATPNPS
jgi:glycerol-3-phosphate dehydrogenase